ncbi:MAG: metal ABC transporter permease [Planctomyces sp.]|nr:metal ABC transporter permease [Planctomyces sp.]
MIRSAAVCGVVLPSLADPNTRTVLLGSVLLGVSAALIGTFLFLRRRSLLGDVVGHAALPGIAIAFMILETIRPGLGRTVPGLLVGAGASGLAGAQCVSLIRRWTRVQTDAALAVVLSVFYGAGVLLLTIIQRMPTGSAAGLKDYLSGKAAALLVQDVWVFGGASGVILAVTLLLFKELTLLCFDSDYASAAGLPVRLLDTVLTVLAAAVTVVGMQTVGLLLVTAILVIPPAAARFWTDDVRRLAGLSALIGGASAAIGVLFSAAIPRLSAGPTIVLAGGLLFGLSLGFGSRRGVVWHWLAHRQDVRRADRLDLLRAIYEALETQGRLRPSSGQPEALQVSAAQLEPFRTWPARRLESALSRAAREGLLQPAAPGEYLVTSEALAEARRIVRNHRLWELYLIRYADAALAAVDRYADRIEHILDPDLVRELETALDRETAPAVPVSPHLV